MNKIFILFAAIFIFLSPFAGQAEEIIIPHDTGILLEINDQDYSLTGFSSDSSKKIISLDSKYADPVSEINGYYIPVLHFTFAVPLDADLSVDITVDNLSESIKGGIPLRNEIYEKDNYRGEQSYLPIEPFAEITKSGIKRGVRIISLRVNPFYYDPVSEDLRMATEYTVNLDYGVSLPAKQAEIKDNRLSVFSGIDNVRQLPALMGSTAKIKKKYPGNKLLNNEEWYDPEKEYIRLYTSRDGIAAVRMSSVIDQMPEWKNKNSASLHMIFHGEKYPYYIEDDDGILNDNDIVYFYGHHARGDSTFFNHYTFNAAFFLYYDENEQPEKLSEMTLSQNPAGVLGKVRIDHHIEEEHIYNGGRNFTISETVKAEKWYWNVLIPDLENANIPQSKFNIREIFTPVNSRYDSLKIIVHYNGVEDSFPRNGKMFYPKYDLTYYLNNEEKERNQFTLADPHTFENKIPGSELFAGPNELAFYYGIVPDSIGQIGIDYFTLEGIARPFAANGKADFHIENRDDDFSLKVPGFSGPDILAVDLISKTFRKFKADAGFTFRTGARNGGNPVFSSAISDFTAFDKRQGLHITYLNGKDFNYRYFENDYDAARKLIDSLPAGTAIAGGFNGIGTLPGSIAGYFAGLGSSEAGSLAEGEIWIFAMIKSGDFFTESAEMNRGSLAEFAPAEEGSSYSPEMNLPGGKDYHLIMNDGLNIEYATVKRMKKTDLRNSEFNSDVLIVSHPDFLDAARRLAEYRSESLGLKVDYFDSEEIYKEFSFGQKSPHAIKDFAKNAYYNWQNKPTHLIIIGDASWDARNVWQYTEMTDYVPSYGLPVSDFWFGLLEGDDRQPELIVGRIPATTLKEANDYIDKLIEYDTSEVRPWNKKFLYLSGGITDLERENFYDARFNWVEHVLPKPICGDTASVRKMDSLPVGETEAGEIRKFINAGAGWVNFFGHASAQVFDMDGWQVSELNNFGKYSVFTTLSCNSGAFAEAAVQCRNEEYIFAPRKGFIVAGGSSGIGSVFAERKLYTLMMDQLSRSGINKREFGSMLNGAKSQMYVKDSWEANTVDQYTIIGDPLLRIKIDTIPDLYLNRNNIELQNETGSAIFTEENDSVIINGDMFNAGTYQPDQITLRIERQYEGETETKEIEFSGACLDDAFRASFSVNGMAGRHDFTLTIDPEEELSDGKRENNRITFSIDVFTTGLLTLDPQEFWNVDPQNPRFRFINPLKDNSKFEYEFVITALKDTNALALAVSDPSEIIEKENYIEWLPGIELEAGQSYWFRARLKNINNDGKLSSWMWLPVHAEDIIPEKVHWRQNTGHEYSQNDLNKVQIIENDGPPEMRLTTESYSFTGIGLLGVAGGPKRWAKIVVADEDTLEQRVFVDSEFSRGFNVVRINSIDNTGSFRRFDTFNDYESSIRLVDYLRDTVTAYDYVIMITSDRSFDVPFNMPADSRGHIDTLRKVLREFGADKADSLDLTVSYALMGRKGAQPGTVPEDIDYRGDTARIDGDLKIYRMNGSIETVELGPARFWENFSAQIDKDEESAAEIEIIGINKDGTEENIRIEDQDYDLNLADISAEEYPNLKFRFNLKKDEPFSNLSVKNLNCRFEPLPEIAAKKNESYVDPDSLMRGFESVLFYSLENISPRVTAPEQNLSILFVHDDDRFGYAAAPVPELSPDESYSGNISFSTATFSNDNVLQAVANDPLNFSEYYSFNNSFDRILHVYEDDVKPVIELYADSSEVIYGSHVAIRPQIMVDIFDNSPLPINDPSRLKVKINGEVQDRNNTEGYDLQFMPDNADNTHKLRLTFTPDSLDFRENSIEIAAEDASGNSDTLFTIVNVSLNAFIEDAVVYPNPFNEYTTFEFNFISSRNEGTAFIDIFNTIGQKVKQLKLPARIGEMSVRWDALDKDGRSLPVGAYYYMLRVESRLYVEPVRGTLIIGR